MGVAIRALILIAGVSALGSESPTHDWVAEMVVHSIGGGLVGLYVWLSTSRSSD